MQTFLPYPDFDKSAAVLDKLRLNKQIVEGGQLLNSILGVSSGKGWSNHPAKLMWQGYEGGLVKYITAMYDEFVRRGGKVEHKSMIRVIDLLDMIKNTDNPPWLGNEYFHSSHRANLLRKNYEYYSQFGWTEDPDMPYVWPVDKTSRLVLS